MDQGSLPEIDVLEFARMRDDEAPHFLLDVREPWEISLCAVEGSVNIPMGQIPSRLEVLPRDRPIVVLCHHGVRSQRVAAWLRQNGLPNAVNLQSGIDAWRRYVDPSMQSY